MPCISTSSPPDCPLFFFFLLLHGTRMMLPTKKGNQHGDPNDVDGHLRREVTSTMGTSGRALGGRGATGNDRLARGRHRRWENGHARPGVHHLCSDPRSRAPGTPMQAASRAPFSCRAKPQRTRTLTRASRPHPSRPLFAPRGRAPATPSSCGNPQNEAGGAGTRRARM